MPKIIKMKQAYFPNMMLTLKFRVQMYIVIGLSLLRSGYPQLSDLSMSNQTSLEGFGISSMIFWIVFGIIPNLFSKMVPQRNRA